MNGEFFDVSGKKPDYLGVQKNQPALALCPATKNCVSTSENVADLTHYAPPWSVFLPLPFQFLVLVLHILILIFLYEPKIIKLDSNFEYEVLNLINWLKNLPMESEFATCILILLLI